MFAPAHAEQADRNHHTVTVRIDRAAVMSGDSEAVGAARTAIMRAARRVCRLTGPARLTLRDRRDGQACLADAVERTVASVRSPWLASAFADVLGAERLARLEWGRPQFTAFAVALPSATHGVA